MLSLGYVDADVPVGSELTMVWGEEDGGSEKPVVERHAQAEIRAIVSPVPYSEVARTEYAEGSWRTKAGRQLATSSSAETSSSVAERYGAWSASSSNTRSQGWSRIIRRWSAGAIARSCSAST